MKTLRALLLALPLAAAVSLLACGGGGEDNHFVGTWFADDGRTLTFTEETWQDSDGDAGDYSYDGEYPEYTVTFELPDRTYLRQATFLDRNTMDLCLAFASGDAW